MDYFIDATPGMTADELASSVYPLACRTDFRAPGFALVRQSNVSDSLAQRREMVALKESLSAIHTERTHMALGWFTMSRFDQKITTKLHRDAGPSESLLILGYEPTEVVSAVSIADYSVCAHMWKMTPDELLEQYNPMYEMGSEILERHTTMLGLFDHTAFQLLIVNNSSCPYVPNGNSWLGVLHGARMISYEENQPRILNSTSVVPQELTAVIWER